MGDGEGAETGVEIGGGEAETEVGIGVGGADCISGSMLGVGVPYAEFVMVTFGGAAPGGNDCPEGIAGRTCIEVGGEEPGLDEGMGDWDAGTGGAGDGVTE